MNSEDSKLSGSFRELRRTDARLASDFESAWPAASGHALSGKRRLWLRVALAAAALVVAVAGLYLVRGPASVRPRITLSQWRAPTDVLLTGSRSELLRTTPQLGGKILDVKREKQ
jgi:hypothetical protein